jgi:HSP20 family protein
MFFRNDPFFADFDRWTRTGIPNRSVTSASIPVDAVRHQDTVELSFDLPGVPVEAIELTVDQGVLRLAVERSFEPAEGDQVISNERWVGARSRSFRLGDGLDVDELTTAYEAGVLTVTIPVRAADQPRRIEIDTDRPAELAS